MRPYIGITTSTLERAPEGPLQKSYATYVTYAHCVYQAGGMPLLLPSLPDAEDADAVLARLDGLLLSGGGDIDPTYWGEPPHPAMGAVDPLRDQFELALTRAALARDLPVLGICRGVQVMAVATGGDLWQDLPSQVPGNVGHRQTCARHLPCHTVRVFPGAVLAHVLYPDVSVDAEVHLSVNSFHHQAPRNCGTILSVSAESPDGLTEALAAPGATFVLGVQWHPEEMTESDPVQAHLFTALLEAARG